MSCTEVSSLESDPQRLLKAVRYHSRVENKLHWTLDVAFEEDLSRVRTGHAAQNLGIVRRLALSLLKQETSRSVGVKLKAQGCGLELGLPSEGAHRRKLNAIALRDSPEENAHLIEVVPRPLGPVAEAKDRAWVRRRR